MPVLQTLVGYHMQAVKSSELDEKDGEADVVDVWTLVFTDVQSHDQIRIAFRKDTRDMLVRQLTGGIVLAGGELPKL